MARGVILEQSELALLHETLSYAIKRTYTEGERVRLRGLLGRVEDRMLGDGDPGRPFTLTEPEHAALDGAVESFCSALDHPLAAEVSRGKATRVRTILTRFEQPVGPLDRIRRLFRRRG